MMRNYKVPIGMTEEERKAALAIFAKKKGERKWYEIWKPKTLTPDLFDENQHSNVIYLMS